MAGKRTLKVEILGDAKGAQGAFGLVDKAAGGFGSKIGGIAKGIGVGTAVIGTAVGLAAIAGIRAASDYEESFNKVGEVFDDQAGRITNWSQNAARAFGLSKSEALAAAGDFGNLFTAMGIATGSAADMSTGIVGLAADLGSFNNIGTPEALEKIRAGLVGETEPLRSLGVNLDAASIKAKAMAMGLADASGELTPAAKAQAAYALILEQTTNAQGDFQRTKSGMANSLKIIGASFDDLKVNIGQRVLPAVAPLIAAFAEHMPRALDIVGSVLDTVAGKLSGPLVSAFRTVQRIGSTAVSLVRDGFATLQQALSGDWADNPQILGFHRIVGNIGIVMREQVIPAVRQIVGFFQENLPRALDIARQGLDRIVGALTPVFGFIIDHKAEVVAGLAGIAIAFGIWTVATLAQAVAMGLLSTAMAPVTLLILGIGAASIGLYKAWQGNWGGIQEKTAAVLEWLQANIPPAFEAVKTAIGAVVGFVKTLIDGDWSSAWSQLGSVVSAAGSFLTGTVLPGLLSAVGSFLTGAVPVIASHLAAWGAQFIAWVAPQIPPLLVALGGLLVDLGGWLISTALPEIVRKLAQWGAAFIGWVATDVLPKLPGALAEILTAVGGWIAGVVGDLASEGAKIGLAILSGIGSAIRNGAAAIVKSAIDYVASLIPSWARKALDIRSPSKVMHDTVGLPIAQGIANGILAGVDDIDAAMRWVNRHIWEQSQPQLAMNPVMGNHGRLNPVGAGGSRGGGSRARDTDTGAASGLSLSGRAITLVMPSGQLVGQWYAGYQAGEDALAPVGIGGLV